MGSTVGLASTHVAVHMLLAGAVEPCRPADSSTTHAATHQITATAATAAAATTAAAAATGASLQQLLQQWKHPALPKTVAPIDELVRATVKPALC